MQNINIQVLRLFTSPFTPKTASSEKTKLSKVWTSVPKATTRFNKSCISQLINRVDDLLNLRLFTILLPTSFVLFSAIFREAIYTQHLKLLLG